MLRNLNRDSLRCALCLGGFVGWTMTVMYICEKSLELYGTSSLYAVTNIIFGGALLLTLAVLLMLMFHLDFEGLLGHRYFRVVPAVLMAESGLALAFTNADSFSVYAVITGICAAFGALAVFSSLLRVRVSQRLFAVAAGTAIGGAVRLADHVIYSHMDMTRGVYALAILSGVLALLTVRSSGFSKEEMPIISYSEASHKTLLRNLPAAYFLLAAFGGLYNFCLGQIAAHGAELYAPVFRGYILYTYLPYIAVALIAALFVKFHNVTPLFIFGVCLLSYSAIMLYLPYFSRAEESVFLICFFVGQCCFGIFAYLFIITFSMDRQHPMFYAIFGYACAIAAQLGANVFNLLFPSQRKEVLLVVLAVLLVISAPVIWFLLKKHGLTQESFELHNALRGEIAATAERLSLSDREKYMLELVVLGGYTAEQLPDKMMLSRNTVRAQSRNLLQKLEVETISDLRPFFEARLSQS